jgi:hypothetical protein
MFSIFKSKKSLRQNTALGIMFDNFFEEFIFV